MAILSKKEILKVFELMDLSTDRERNKFKDMFNNRKCDMKKNTVVKLSINSKQNVKLE